MGSAKIYDRIYNQIKRMNVDILLMQETHLTAQEGERLRKKWRGQLYNTMHSAYARAAAIWIHPNIPYECEDNIID